MTADAGEDVEKEEHSFIVGGIASLYNHSGNQSGSSSENWTTGNKYKCNVDSHKNTDRSGNQYGGSSENWT